MSWFADTSTQAVIGAASLLIGATLVRRAGKRDTPVLFHCSDLVTTSLLPRLPTLRHGAYRPPLVWPTGVLQSALAEAGAPPLAATPFTRESFELPTLEEPTPPSACCPGSVPPGIVSIDWLHQDDEQAPICLLIPGLTGSSASGYIRRAAVALHASGVRVGCYNPRRAARVRSQGLGRPPGRPLGRPLGRPPAPCHRPLPATKSGVVRSSRVSAGGAATTLFAARSCIPLDTPKI